MVEKRNLISDSDFETIIAQNKGIIYKVAHSYCRDPDDRKDLVQEIVFQLWGSFHRYDKSSKLSTWMYRVSLNVAISFFRKDSKRKKVSTALSDNLIEIIPNEEPDDKEEKVNLLLQFISGLPSLDRALMLLYLEDKSQKEIGEILGLTETNVSTRVARIKEKLKIKFGLTD